MLFNLLPAGILWCPNLLKIFQQFYERMIDYGLYVIIHDIDSFHDSWMQFFSSLGGHIIYWIYLYYLYCGSSIFYGIILLDNFRNKFCRTFVSHTASILVHGDGWKYLFPYCVAIILYYELIIITVMFLYTRSSPPLINTKTIILTKWFLVPSLLFPIFLLMHVFKVSFTIYISNDIVELLYYHSIFYLLDFLEYILDNVCILYIKGLVVIMGYLHTIYFRVYLLGNFIVL